MQLKISLFVSQCLIFCYQYDFVNTKPMIGPAVRHAHPNEYSFVVSLIKLLNPRTFIHKCTGTLISKRDVAIAAHCIRNEYRPNFRVAVGSADYRLGEQISILYWLTFNSWATRNQRQIRFEENDIANIRLTENVHDAFVPVRFSNIVNSRLYGLNAKIAGWGSPNNTELNPEMKTAEVTVLTNRQCIDMVAALARQPVEIPERQYLCSKADPFVILNSGDSGGPILFRNTLIGINKGCLPTSLAETEPNLINVHLSINFYRDFLVDCIQNRS